MNDLPFSFKRASDKCFILSDFDPETSKQELWDLFERYGKVKEIQMIRTNNMMAAIIFSVLSATEDLNSEQLVIRDEIPKLRPASLSDYAEWKCTPILGDKFSMGGLSTPSTFVEEWSSSRNIRLDVNVIEKYVEIFFYHLNEQYRLRIRYGSVLQNTILQRSSNISTVIVAAKYPAYFWRMVSSQEPREAFDLSCWERVTEIPMYSREKPSEGLLLNSWSVYKVELDIDKRTHETLKQVLQKATQTSLPEQNIDIDREYKRKVDYEKNLAGFPFEVQYMFQHIFNLKILREYNVEDDMYRAIGELKPHIACRLLSLMSAGQSRLYDPNSTINHIFKHNQSITNPPEPISDDSTYLRKLIITPTSIYPLQPVVQKMNHLQYQHKKYADRFLYVEFTDEELGPIVPCPNINQNDKLYRRIFRVLRRGLKIAGRQYEFLCTSKKDLKAHSCWFFAPTEDLSRDDILYWMGDFAEIKNVAKYIASVGQAVEPRLTELEIKPTEIEEIADYEHNNVVFSKDCGKMSPHVAREIARALGLDYTPSVVRFSLAGAKGILMLSNYLQKRKIHLRSGQIHFDTDRLTLEVSKVSKRKQAYLDRHSIMLLFGLGVHPIEFQKINEQVLQDYLIGNSQKSSFLNTLMDDYYSNYLFSSFHQVLLSGFLERRDPLVTNLVLAFQNEILRETKEGKLYVKNGARAFAIMDETGTLQHDQVFFQTSTSNGKKTETKVIQDYCVIFHDSSYSPKDVIIAKAVDSPRLRSYTNVLVYPATGLKDIPSCCSIEAPDNDDFTIIWEKSLVPRTSNRAPTVLTEPKPPQVKGNIGFGDVTKFMVNYISNDLTQLSKDAWTASVDRYDSSIHHGKVSFLAGRLATALDYVNTGISDSLSSESICSELYEYSIPDFMNQETSRSYLSRKPLGLMHRTAQSIAARPSTTERSEYDPRLYVEGMHRYILEARKTRLKYNNSLRLLMGQYCVQSETEFVSGLVANWSKYISKNGRSEITKGIREAYRQFKKKWRVVFEHEFYAQDMQNLSETEINERVEAKAAAWYYVTYHPSENLNRPLGMYSAFLSFPWVIDDYLIHIVRKNNTRRITTDHKNPLPESLINSEKSNIVSYIMEENDSDDGNSDHSHNDNYYEQRASPGGLVITEATFISRLAGGYKHAPGIYTQDQIDHWKKITSAVHKKGAVIFLQIWHIGRAASSKLNPNGEQIVSASAIGIPGKTNRGFDFETPRALEIDEIDLIVQDFKQAAINAMEAGFDGVEIHNANGYLLDQFLNSGSNKRKDRYGGSIENRARFSLQVVEAITEAIGIECTAIRFSPDGKLNGMQDDEPLETWGHMVRVLQEKYSRLAYLHFIEPHSSFYNDLANETDTLIPYRMIWKGPFISAGGYSNTIDYAVQIAEETDNLIAFGRAFIANPDLPKRLRENRSLNKYDRSTFYTHDAIGYTDYPFFDEKNSRL